jgi:hypothetical protein
MTGHALLFLFGCACRVAGPTFISIVLREWAVTHAAIFTAAISLAAIGEPA